MHPRLALLGVLSATVSTMHVNPRSLWLDNALSPHSLTADMSQHPHCAHGASLLDCVGSMHAAAHMSRVLNVHPTIGSDVAAAHQLSWPVQRALQLRKDGFLRGAGVSTHLVAQGGRWYDAQLARWPPAGQEQARHCIVRLLVRSFLQCSHACHLFRFC